MSEAPERIWAVTEPNDISADTLGDVYAQQVPDGMVGTPVEYIRADRIKELAARAEAAEAKLAEQVEWVKILSDDLIAAEGREAWLKAVRNAAATAAYEDAAKVGVDYVNGDLAQPEMGIWWNIMQRAPADSTSALERVRREARNKALEEAAARVAPIGERPCDCDSCYCGNPGDNERVAAWDEANSISVGIRAMMEDDT